MGNPIVHVEVIGPDPARLREFYSQLFGWDARAGAPAAGGIGGGSLGAAITLTPQRNDGGGVTVGHLRDPAGNLVGVAGPR